MTLEGRVVQALTAILQYGAVEGAETFEILPEGKYLV